VKPYYGIFASREVDRGEGKTAIIEFGIFTSAKLSPSAASLKYRLD
tara:strand:- start:586 stop:723 length:138 start_codon:yes stop_codon:yes gene_type:complete